MRIVRSFLYAGIRSAVYCDKCHAQGKPMVMRPAKQGYPRIKCMACGHTGNWSRGVRFSPNKL